MVSAAPRYDEQILTLIHGLDDRARPMAETCRRVGAAADRLGLTRPSYVHVRRLIVERRQREDDERDSREALREIALDVAIDLVRGVRVNAYDVADRVRDAETGA